MNDEEFRKMLEEDDKADPREALREDFEFMKSNWFNYLTAAALSFSVVACVVALFLFIVSKIVNG